MIERKRVQPVFDGVKSLTQQNFKDEVDINNITRKYLRTGLLSSGKVGNRVPIFADFSEMDYMEMMNTINDAKAQFDSLPAKIRRRFGNDPRQLARFLDDPKNKEEAIKLGLVEEKALPKDEPSKEPVAAPVAAPVAPAPKADPEANPRGKGGN